MTTEFKEEDLPCYQCICLAACVAKPFMSDILVCSLVYKYLRIPAGLSEPNFTMKYEYIMRYLRFKII